MRTGIALGMMALTLAGCATAVPPVEVTRFHGPPPVAASGTIAVEDAAGGTVQSMEFRTYAAAVMQELQRVGFTEVAPPGAHYLVPAQYVALVAFERRVLTAAQARSPVSVGVGGSTGSYGSGLGVGVGIDLSGKPKDQIVSRLSVQIRDRKTSEAVWEGRAETMVKEGAPAAQPGIAAAKLANALFRDYPGPSGQTITVK